MLPSLSENRELRLFAFTALYVAQGLPYGMFMIAIPTWLSFTGASVATVANFTAIVALPWSFKLIVAPFMDWLRFPAMGSRRPWVILAQIGIVLPWLYLAFNPETKDIALLTALGFLLNLFGATQDVAVDGMAIEILPENERALANSLMFAGQVAGISFSSAVGAALLKNYGLSSAGWMMGFCTFAILLVPLLLREHPGERLLPWSPGAARPSDSVRHTQLGEFGQQLLHALLLPTSILILLGQFLDRVGNGIFIGIMPSLSTHALHWSQTVYPNWASGAGIASAVLGVVLAPMIARAGTDRAFGMAVLAKLMCLAAIAFSAPYWALPGFMPVAIIMVNGIGQIASVAVVALCMSACSPRIAATQFAIYMATANIATAAGGTLVALLSQWGIGFSGMFLVAAALTGSVLLFWRHVDIETHRTRLEPLVN